MLLLVGAIALLSGGVVGAADHQAHAQETPSGSPPVASDRTYSSENGQVFVDFADLVRDQDTTIEGHTIVLSPRDGTFDDHGLIVASGRFSPADAPNTVHNPGLVRFSDNADHPREVTIDYMAIDQQGNADGGELTLKLLGIRDPTIVMENEPRTGADDSDLAPDSNTEPTPLAANAEPKEPEAAQQRQEPKGQQAAASADAMPEEPRAAKSTSATRSFSDDLESGTSSWLLDNHGEWQIADPVGDSAGRDLGSKVYSSHTCIFYCNMLRDELIDANNPLRVNLDWYVSPDAGEDGGLRVEMLALSGRPITLGEYRGGQDAGGAWKSSSLWVRIAWDYRDDSMKLRFVATSQDSKGIVQFDNLRVVERYHPYGFDRTAVPPGAPYVIQTDIVTQDFEDKIPRFWSNSVPRSWAESEPYVDPSPLQLGKTVLSSRDCSPECWAVLGTPLDTTVPLEITFDRLVTRMATDTGGLYLQYSTDGMRWSNIAVYAVENGRTSNEWSSERLVFDIPEDTAQLRFVAKSQILSDVIQVDNVVVRQFARPGSEPVFREDFEGGLGSWSLSGNGVWSAVPSGGEFAILGGTVLRSEDCGGRCIITLDQTLNTTTPLSISVTRLLGEGLTENEGLRASYSVDGGTTWPKIVQYTANDGLDTGRYITEHMVLDIPQDEAMFRLVTRSDGSGERVIIDNVDIRRVPDERVCALAIHGAVDFGGMVAGQSREVKIAMRNDGNLDAMAMITAGGWTDSSGTVRMEAGQTRVSSAPMPYDSKAQLGDAMVEFPIAASAEMDTYLELQASPMISGYRGDLTQDITVSYDCS